MAQIDLGKIKPVWKGAWAGSTVYEKNDMVSESNNSYICTAAHTADASTFSNDSANWDIMATGSNLPVQTGNSGKVLQTDGSALSWAEASSGKIKQVVNFAIDDAYSYSSTSEGEVNSAFRKSITPTASDSKILVMFHVWCAFNHQGAIAGYFRLKRSIGGGSYSDFNLPSTNLGSRTAAHFIRDNVNSGTGENSEITSLVLVDEPNTTSEVTYSLFGRCRDAGSIFFNRMGNDTNNSAQARGKSFYTFIEIGA